MTTFYVWRRDSPHPHLDDYIGVTAYHPDTMPHSPGETYRVLLETKDWPTARSKVERMRNGEPS